jgi:hypothetical protein
MLILAMILQVAVTSVPQGTNPALANAYRLATRNVVDSLSSSERTIKRDATVWIDTSSMRQSAASAHLAVGELSVVGTALGARGTIASSASVLTCTGNRCVIKDEGILIVGTALAQTDSQLTVELRIDWSVPNPVGTSRSSAGYQVIFRRQGQQFILVKVKRLWIS